MSPFAPFTEEQFHYIAMGKARAWTWDTLAQQLDMPVEIVERVAWTHEKQWNRALTKAERLVARETISEVAVVLRRDIRNAEPHLHATLANSLTRVLKLQQEYAPPRRSRTPNGPPTPMPEAKPQSPAAPASTPTASQPTPQLGSALASLGALLLWLAMFLLGNLTRETPTHDAPALVVQRCEPSAKSPEMNFQQPLAVERSVLAFWLEQHNDCTRC